MSKKLTARLRELSKAIAEGDRSELTMRIPAEPERDADLVLSTAADLIDSYDALAPPTNSGPISSELVVERRGTNECDALFVAPDLLLHRCNLPAGHEGPHGRA